jgi:uncharacterized protein (DUF4415 family)
MKAHRVRDDDNPEWTSAEFAAAKPFAEVFPEIATEELARRGRGPQKAPTKRMVSLRLDSDVLARWRASGKGWQSRINETLAQHAPRRRAQRATTNAAANGRTGDHSRKVRLV